MEAFVPVPNPYDFRQKHCYWAGLTCTEGEITLSVRSDKHEHLLQIEFRFYSFRVTQEPSGAQFSVNPHNCGMSVDGLVYEVWNGQYLSENNPDSLGIYPEGLKQYLVVVFGQELEVLAPQPPCFTLIRARSTPTVA